MRILLVSPYGSLASGVARFVRELEASLTSRGHIVRTEPSREPAPNRSFGNLKLAIGVVRSLWSSRSSIDVVHCQQLHLISVSAALVARVLGRPVIITVHGLSPRPGGPRGIVYDMVTWLGRRIPSRLVSVAHSLGHEVGASVVIPNGVQVSSIGASVRTSPVTREALGLGGTFVMLFLGRVTRDKGVPQLLHALREIRGRSPIAVALILVGPVEEALRGAVALAEQEGGVRSLGEVADPWWYFAAADIVILPSFHEGLPLSLLEAMAAGLPIIASRVGDVPSIVRERETGWLVDPGDTEGLASALMEAVTNRASIDAMGERGRILVGAEFDFAATVRAYEDEYRALAAANPAPPTSHASGGNAR